LKDPGPLLPNLAFFEALANTAEIKDPQEREAWSRELQAAVLVLRFFSDWAGFPAITHDAISQRKVMRDKIAAVQNHSARYLFGSVVGLMYRSDGDPEDVTAPLLAYAWLLEEREQYTLATDLLWTVARALEPARGPGRRMVGYPLAATIERRLGDLALRRGDLDAAESHYQQQLTFARFGGDKAMILHARTLIVRVQQTRGNLGTADSALGTIIADAAEGDDARAEAYARRIRGSVRHRQGRYEEALADHFRAYTIAPEWVEREWLLVDIAACCFDLGHLALARLAFISLAKTAHNAPARSLALINLLEMAVLEDDRTSFDVLVRQLNGLEMPIEQQLYRDLYQAGGIALWEGAEAGRAAYDALVVRARQVGQHAFEFRAIEAAGKLDRPVEVVEPAAEPSGSATWESLSKAIEAECYSRLEAVGATAELSDE